jgi:hypothetical protein
MSSDYAVDYTAYVHILDILTIRGVSRVPNSPAEEVFTTRGCAGQPTHLLKRSSPAEDEQGSQITC